MCFLEDTFVKKLAFCSRFPAYCPNRKTKNDTLFSLQSFPLDYRWIAGTPIHFPLFFWPYNSKNWLKTTIFPAENLSLCIGGMWLKITQFFRKVNFVSRDYIKPIYICIYILAKYAYGSIKWAINFPNWFRTHRDTCRYISQILPLLAYIVAIFTLGKNIYY